MNSKTLCLKSGLKKGLQTNQKYSYKVGKKRSILLIINVLTGLLFGKLPFGKLYFKDGYFDFGNKKQTRKPS